MDRVVVVFQKNCIVQLMNYLLASELIAYLLILMSFPNFTSQSHYFVAYLLIKKDSLAKIVIDKLYF